MSKANKQQAKVSWCAEDLEEDVDWSVAKRQRFLDENEDYIQQKMIEAGREAIEDCLRWHKDEEVRGVRK